jgi:hypothetical protein
MEKGRRAKESGVTKISESEKPEIKKEPSPPKYQPKWKNMSYRDSKLNKMIVNNRIVVPEEIV